MIREVTRLIQVCRDMSDPKTRHREIRALLKAGAELKCRDLLILTEDTQKEEAAEWFGFKWEIRYLPMWKWLQEEI